MNRFVLLIMWLCLYGINICHGEEWPFGSKYIENINSTAYRGDIQIWAVERGEDDYMFFATAAGLSVWDGVRWSFYKTQSGTYLRSLFYDKTSRVLYSGGDNEFGRWRQNKYGDFEYERLYRNTDGNMNRIFWRCYALGDDVYFQTHEMIFRWQADVGRTDWLEPQRYISYLHLCGGRLLVQLGEEFYALQGLELIPLGIKIENRVVNVVERKGTLYLFSEDEGIFVFEKNRLRKLNAQTDELLRKAKIFSAGAHGTERFAVGTVLDGFYLLDTSGNIVESVNLENGLLNTTVLSFGIDREENIWLGLDGGIARIYEDMREKYYQSFTGEIGSVYAVQYFKGSLFLGTNKGLFELKPDNSIHFITGSQGQVWDIYPIGEDLIVSHDKGMFRAEQGELTALPFPGSWKLKPFIEEEGLYFSVDFTGLTLYEMQEGHLRLRNRLENYNGSANNAYIDKYGYIWLLYNDGKAARLKTDRERMRVTEVKNYDVPHAVHVLPGFCKLDNEIVFYTGIRAYCYDITSDSLVYNPYYSELLEICGEGVISITQSDNLFFYITGDRTGIIERQDDKLVNKGYILSKSAGHLIPQAFRRIIPVSREIMALGMQNGVAFYKLRQDAPEDNGQMLKLRKARWVTMEAEHWLDLTREAPFVVPFQTREIDFYFTGLSPSRTVEYRIGEGKWTTVILEDELTLPHLKSGEYTLYVRNVGYGEDAPVFVQKMEVEQHWLWNEKNILFLFVGIIALALLINHLNVKWIERKYKRVQKKQEEEMLQQQKAYELQMLRMELKEKDKKLVNFTMEGINRNNMLNEIREEVIGLKNNFANPEYKIKNIVRKIDSYLNDKENWKIFEKYFNNIYDGFFDRLMQKYPDLTTNELKICAYIKLNFTSKEMAVLMNISPASVEMARYRLRKKLNISTDISLVNLMAGI